ncbi:MAG: DoxX family membrane protein [Planctomycetales bacterium]|nr:DoxX family membrane protein [Planctomycetales bacterium]
MQNYARLGIFGILALIALRVGIGWHFYMEGVAKVRGNDFSSVGFLDAAKGPLADKFQQLVWDHDGRLRLDKENVNGFFSLAADQAAAHFGLTDEQKRSLERVKRQYIEKLNDVYAEGDEAIFKYWESVDRIATMKGSKMWNDVSSLRGQKEKIEKDRMSGVRETLAAVDAIWKQYEGRLNSVANATQRQQAGYFYFVRPGEGLMTTRVVDRIVPIFDMVVGILLILGLLTPLAAWAGAIFLISVVLSQMPGYPGTQPTYFQAVECLALIVLATTDAGRYAGLDFLPWAWWQKRRAAKLAAS